MSRCLGPGRGGCSLGEAVCLPKRPSLSKHSGTSHCCPLATLVLHTPHAVFQWLTNDSKCGDIDVTAYALRSSVHVCCNASAGFVSQHTCMLYACSGQATQVEAMSCTV